MRIQDLGSRDGTWVDDTGKHVWPAGGGGGGGGEWGRRLTPHVPHRLRAGATFHLGATARVVFRLAEHTSSDAEAAAWAKHASAAGVGAASCPAPAASGLPQACARVPLEASASEAAAEPGFIDGAVGVLWQGTVLTYSNSQATY